MDTAQNTLNLVEDFRTELSGRFPESTISNTVSFIESASGSYPAVLASELGKMTCTIVDGKTFTSGSFTSGILPTHGLVYTNNLDLLYADTVSFLFVATPVYIALYFYDSSSQLLGYFTGAAISLTSGSGGGEGSWS